MSKNFAEYESVLLFCVIAKVNRKKLRWISFLLYHKIFFWCNFSDHWVTTECHQMTTREKKWPPGDHQLIKRRPSFRGRLVVIFDAYKTHTFNFFHIQKAYKMTQNAYRTHTSKKKASHFFYLKKRWFRGTQSVLQGIQNVPQNRFKRTQNGLQSEKKHPIIHKLETQ
jgi:hypothetical protein